MGLDRASVAPSCCFPPEPRHRLASRTVLWRARCVCVRECMFGNSSRTSSNTQDEAWCAALAAARARFTGLPVVDEDPGPSHAVSTAAPTVLPCLAGWLTDLPNLHDMVRPADAYFFHMHLRGG